MIGRRRGGKEKESHFTQQKRTLAKRTFKKLNGKQSWYKTKPVDRAEENEKMKERRERAEDDQTIPEGWTQSERRFKGSCLRVLYTQQC